MFKRSLEHVLLTTCLTEHAWRCSEKPGCRPVVLPESMEYITKQVQTMGNKAKKQVKQGNRKTACKSQSMLWLTTLHERTDAMALWCYQSLLICLILHFLLCNLQARTLKDFCIRGRIPSLSYWYFLIVS